MFRPRLWLALRTASQAFSLTDSLRARGGVRRWLKLAARSVVHRRHLQPLWSALDEPRNRWLVDRDPQLPVRSVRPYLSSTLGVAERTGALIDHLEWLHRTLPAATLRHIHAGDSRAPGLPLWSHGDGSERLGLHLTAAYGCYREAELLVQLRLGGRPLVGVGLTLVQPQRISGYEGAGSIVVLVGVCQGVAGTAEAIRHATRLAHGLRPRALLMTAVQALSCAAGAGVPLLVGSSAHVLSSYRRTLGKRVAVDYDAMWQDLGARRLAGPWWALPAEPMSRAPGAVPSNKRAQQRRRSALRQAAFDGCRAVLLDHFLPSDFIRAPPG